MEWHLPGLIAPSNRTPPPRYVTDVVLELGLASHDDVHAAVEAAKATGGRAEALLVQNGVLDDERLAIALAERYGLDRLELDHFPFDPGAAALVSVDTALHHEALPVAHLDGGRLLVAVADPAGGPAAGAIGVATRRDVVPAVAPRHRLRALIESAASRRPVPLPDAARDAHAAHAAPPPHDELVPPHEPEPGHDAHRISGLERELAEAHERFAGAEERVAAATRRVLDLERELAESHEQFAGAEERLPAANQRVLDLERELAESDGRFAGAEQRVAAATQRVLDLEGDLAESHERLAGVEERVAQGTQRVLDLERELAESHERFASAEERLSAATRRVLELEGDLDHARATIAAVRAAVRVDA